MDKKRTSAVWLHFEEQKGTGVAKCNLCRRPFAYRGGSTSNLRKHLKTKHAGTLLSLGRYMNFKINFNLNGYLTNNGYGF